MRRPRRRNRSRRLVDTPNDDGSPHFLQRVVSGGQTGADRAGLLAAQSLGIATGGWAPKGFRTETGPDLSLRDEFGIREMRSRSYVKRTIQNVIDSNGTIAFRLHTSNGTDKTIGYCQTEQWRNGRPKTVNFSSRPQPFRPCFLVTDISSVEIIDDVVERIGTFLRLNQIKVVNIAGHRETTAGVPHFTETVRQILVRAFRPFVSRATLDDDGEEEEEEDESMDVDQESD